MYSRVHRLRGQLHRVRGRKPQRRRPAYARALYSARPRLRGHLRRDSQHSAAPNGAGPSRRPRRDTSVLCGLPCLCRRVRASRCTSRTLQAVCGSLSALQSRMRRSPCEASRTVGGRCRTRTFCTDRFDLNQSFGVRIGAASGRGDHSSAASSGVPRWSQGMCSDEKDGVRVFSMRSSVRRISVGWMEPTRSP
jgi:hypothetical protein